MSDTFDIEGEVTETPMSRTHTYRKVMKPMLERKRRARINHCLEELKTLMVSALQTEGESITKLEKADVLELTVRHLKRLHQQRMLTVDPTMEQDKYRTGYTACAAEVSRCLSTIPSVDMTIRSKLMSHLGQRLSTVMEHPAHPHGNQQLSVRVPVPTYPTYPVAMIPPKLSSPDSDLGYNSGRESTPSPPQLPTSPPSPLNLKIESQDNVWRPF